jgi:hypothetical protein
MAAANWYPDPTDPSRLRWWDGVSWTEHTSAVPTPQRTSDAAPVPPPYAEPAHPAPGYGTPSYAAHANAAPFFATPSYPGSSAPAYAGQPQSAPFYYVPSSSVPQYGQAGYAGQRAAALVVRRLAGKAYVPSAALAAGVVPARCSRHGNPPAEGLKTTHWSKLPVWVYATMLAGLLIFVIVATVVRKSVVSRSWPFCAECLATRRRNLLLMWASLALIVPDLWLIANSSITDSGVFGIVLLVALFVLPVAALAFGGWASKPRLAGCEVTEDGLLVGIPVAAFSDDVSRVGAVRA